MILRKRKLNRKVRSSRGEVFIKTLDELAFDSVGDLLKNTKRKSSDDAGMSWTGTRTLDELDKYVDEGWLSAEKLMTKMLESIQPPPAELRPEMNRRRRRVRRDFGNEVDIHAIYQGRMDRAWDATEVEEIETVGNKLVHINIILGATAGVSFESALWRGAAAMRIYDVLMRMGKSVAISGSYCSYQPMMDGSSAMVSCRLKAYGEPLRSDRLAAMVTVGFMRQYLMMQGLRAHPTKKPKHHRGYPIDDYQLWSHAAEQDQHHGGAVISIGHCFNKEQAQKVVDKFIRQYTKDEKVEGLSAFEQVHGYRSSDAPHHE